MKLKPGEKAVKRGFAPVGADGSINLCEICTTEESAQWLMANQRIHQPHRPERTVKAVTITVTID